MSRGPATAELSFSPDPGLIEVLRRWWDGARAERDTLSFRRTTEPWSVLVSETMLAQTQVARVAAAHPEFVRAFPSPAACAGAPLGEVLRRWSGLGYNRRAKALWEAARAIVSRHGGAVPGSLAELLALPGVGPYTARAVLAFSFGDPVACLDTNVSRTLLRSCAGRRLPPAELQRLGDALVPAGDARSFNLALMDFGSLVCSARRPGCGDCVLAARCAWRRGGGPDPAEAKRSQGRFKGSDREGRGALVRACLIRPLAPGEVAAAAGWPEHPERAAAVAGALVAEGMLVVDASGALRLA